MQYHETDVHCLHQAKIKWQQMLLSTESFFPGISTVCNNKWVDLLVSGAILGLYLFKISNKIFKIKELTGFIKIHRKWLAAYLNIWYELHFFLPETVRQYVYGCSSSPQSSFIKTHIKM